MVIAARFVRQFAGGMTLSRIMEIPGLPWIGATIRYPDLSMDKRALEVTALELAPREAKQEGFMREVQVTIWTMSESESNVAPARAAGWQ